MWESCGWVCSAPSWWWLSTQGRPGPSQRSLSRWSSSCPCMSLVTHWTKMLGVLEKWCNLIRAKRVVVKVTLPFLLIGMFILRRFYLAGSNWLKHESFKTLKISLIFCKPICHPVLPDQSFVRHLVGTLFAKTKRRVDVLQDLQSLRVVNFPPENNKKHGWADDQTK